MIEKFHSDGNGFPLKSPCMIDCQTDAGLLTLMMDKNYPNYLFVSFDGELRKCVEIEDAPQCLEDDNAVFEFLHELKDSPLVEGLIDHEKTFDESWEQL